MNGFRRSHGNLQTTLINMPRIRNRKKKTNKRTFVRKINIQKHEFNK